MKARDRIASTIALGSFVALLLLLAPNAARAAGCTAGCCQCATSCSDLTDCNSSNCSVPGSECNCKPGKHCVASTGLCSAALYGGLADLTATRTADGVLVSWEIAADQDATSFTIHRAPEAFKTFEVVAGASMQATPGQLKYSFLDRAPDARDNPAYYVVEVLDSKGTSTLHGMAEAAK